MRRRITWLLLPALLAVSAGAWWYLHCGRGVQLRLKYATNRPLRNVTLHVTGRDYKIVEVASGEIIRIHMKPTSESHIELSVPGFPDRLVVDSYFESGYGGYISAEINEAGVEKLEDEVKLICWWPA